MPILYRNLTEIDLVVDEAEGQTENRTTYFRLISEFKKEKDAARKVCAWVSVLGASLISIG